MTLATRLAALFCLASVLGFAGNWSGWLVDSKCYAALERNKSPTDTLNYVDRDKMSEIRYCHPNAKTKSFAVVDQNGLSFSLDAGGNAKAAELVRSAGKKSIGEVSLAGEKNGNTLKVDSISIPR
jgi:hypothetical protein